MEKTEMGWEQWWTVMRRAAPLMQKRDFAAALTEVQAFLSHEAGPEVRSDALGLRADLKERLGDLESAKADLQTARALIGPSYMRYVHEICLGAISRKQAQIDEAASWYRIALQTCMLGERISGGSAL